MWILLAPGAGAPSSSAWMQRYASLLGDLCPVVTFDYDYMREGKRRPDPHARLLAAHQAALERGRREHGREAVLAGKSMGGRIGCHVALETAVLGVICFGFPLCSMGNRAKLRTEVLLALERKALFIQGTRDPLCPLELLQPVLDQRSAESEVYVVDSGNHSLECTKTHLRQTGTTQAQIEAQIMTEVGRFLKNASPLTPARGV